MAIRCIQKAFELSSIGCSVGVRITKLDVPSSYVDSCRPLILDCDYEFGVKDVGFVLKWYHNNISIYQWIPPRPPYIFVSAQISF